MSRLLKKQPSGVVLKAPSITSSKIKTLSVTTSLITAFLITPMAAGAANLSPATVSKVVNIDHLNSLIDGADTSTRHRVIVEYNLPEVTAPQGASAMEADALLMSTNATARESLLSDVFGSIASVTSETMADAYQMEGMDYTPHLIMNLTVSEIDKIAANPNVKLVEADFAVPPLMDQSTVLVKAPAVWAKGGTGLGRAVAVFDTGAKKIHEFLDDAIVTEACYNSNIPSQSATSRCPGGVTASIAPGSGEDCPTSFASGCSHGTHVSGTVLGYNTSRQSGEPLRGMAYRADLISINVFSKVSNPTSCRGRPACVLAYSSDLTKAMNRVYALRNNYKIDSVNMSLGGGRYFSNCNTTSFKTSVDLLRNANIATVIAAGNSGYNDSVGWPACISTAITVASSLDTSNTRSSFSNWGNLIDVVAPGSNITSSVYGSSVGARSSYSSYNGTSMATPHVAGAWAMLKKIYPTKTVSQIEAALKSTGVGITSAGVTKPRIQMEAACKALGGGTCGAGGSTAGPIFASILPTARGTRSGRVITAFANITNAGSSTATGCRITSPDSGSAFQYRASNSTNSGWTAPLNTPVNIPSGQTQNFVFGMLPSSTTSGKNVNLSFDCSNTSPAGRVNGLNTFVYSAAGATSTYADMLAIAATTANTGYINIPGTSGLGYAFVSTINIGNVNTSIRVSVTETALGGADPNMPANLTICILNSSGSCATGFASSHTFTAFQNQPVSFAIRAQGRGTVSNNPALNRAHIYFRRASNNAYVGATSVAVKTQ